MSLSQLIWLFFGFSGRISRAAYFLAALLMSVILAFLLYRALLAQEASGGEAGAWDAALSLSIFVSLWAQAALGVKRLHDFGKPAIFAIALFLPALNIIGFIVLCLIPGDRGPNSYGRLTNAPANR